MNGFLHELLHANSEDSTFGVMALRAVLIFFASILAVRVGDRRLFGKNSIFDTVLALIWGSLLSRAITGNAPFLPTLGVSLLLLLLHWLMGFLAVRIWHIGWLYKGSSTLLIKDGKLLHREMIRLNISENDLMEWIRIRGRLTSFEEVDEAYLERNGQISVIPRKRK